MFKNVMYGTVNTRALAAIINTLDCEVATLTGPSLTVAQRARLRMFKLAHEAFSATWQRMNHYTDPLSYAVAWDAHCESVSARVSAKARGAVLTSMTTMIDEVSVDIVNLFPVSSMEAITAAESALSDLRVIDATFALV